MLNQPPPELFAEPPIRSNFGRRPPRRTLSRAGLLAGGVLLLVVAAGVGYFVSGSGTDSGASGVPTIAAEMPIKQKPDQPGGIDIPHQDVTVFQKLEKEGEQKNEAKAVENLLPSPEVPALATETRSAMMPLMDENAQKKAEQGTVEGAAVATESVAAPSREEMAKDIADSQISPDVAYKPEAKGGVAPDSPSLLDSELGSVPSVATTVGKSPASGAEKKEAVAAKAAAPKDIAPPKEVKKEAKLEVKQAEVKQPDVKQPDVKQDVKKGAKDSAAAPSVTATLPKELFTGDPSAVTQMAKAAVKDSAAKKAEAAPVAAAPVVAGASSAAGGYAIQLASIPDQAKAQEMLGKLKAQYASALGGVSLRLVKADIAGKGTYYRIQGGGQAENSARATCAALKAAGGTCIVVRP